MPNVIQIMLLRPILPFQGRTSPMWAYKPEDPATVLSFYRTSHAQLSKVLSSRRRTRRPRRKTPASTPQTPLARYDKFYSYVWMFLFDKVLNSLFFHLQSWLKKAEWTDNLAPLPKGPRTALLTTMLAVEPYKAPEKKDEEEEVIEGLRSRGPPDTRSGDTHAPSTLEGEKE